MKTRIISAIVLLAIFIPALITGGIFFTGLMLLASLLGLYELLQLKKIDLMPKFM